MQQISPQQLNQWIKSKKDFMLIDVREKWERERFNIGGIHIPMGEVIAHIKEIPKHKDVVFYCEKGIRSTIIIQRLEGYGYYNIFSLTGGMSAWHED